MSIMRALRALVVSWAAVASVPVFGSPVAAQTYTPFSYFQALSTSDMGRVQVKLTPMGLEDIGPSSLAFAVSDNPMNLGRFRAFRRGGYSYSNDVVLAKSFSVAKAELKTMIDGLGALPAVTSGSPEANPALSIAFLDTLGDSSIVFESIIGRRTGADVLGVLLSASAGNSPASRQLRDFACPQGLVPTGAPSNVDTRVTVSFSGWRPDRKHSGQYVGKVKVRNSSATAIAAPIMLVVQLEGNAELANKDGTTCRTDMSGQDFIVIQSMPDLGSGTSVERTLRVANLARSAVKVTFHVLSGAGSM